MSTICGKLCSSILKEHFGENVERVGIDLFKYGQKPMKLICKSPANPVSRKAVRQSLCILIQHGLVTFCPSKAPEIAEYAFKPEKALLLLRYPKYLMVAKKLYGKESETLVEEILRHGCRSLSGIIVHAYRRIRDEGEVDKELIVTLRDHFDILVNKQYIQRCPSPGEALPVPDLLVDSVTRFAPPKVELATLLKYVSSGTWDQNDPVLWSINHARFQQDMRDELLVTAMTRRISKTAGEYLSHLLRQAYLVSPPNLPHSNSVSIQQYREHCRKAKMDVRNLDDYLSVMVEDASGFISRDDLSSNGAYYVNMLRAVEELTWTALASAVETKYGGNAARIFRLVREQEYIEQDEIQKRAMLPDKECKLLTYALVQNGWIHQQELKKGVQKSGPTKTFFLFCVDLNQVVRMYIDTCYKALVNCACRREYEYSQNSILLDKKQRIDAITHHLRQKQASEEDIAEINELLTPPEAARLEKVHATLDKLHHAELEIDGTLFILQLHLELTTV